MRPAKRPRLGVESLEGRELMTAMPLHAPREVAALVNRPVHARQLPLRGTLRGTFAAVPTSVGFAPFDLRGDGRVTPLGRADLHGLLQTLPMNQSAEPLDLSLSNSRGSVNLRLLQDTTPTNPLKQPFRMNYTLLGGTGIYRGVVGTGRADVTLKPDFGTFNTVGQFTLTLHADRAHR